MFVCCECCVLSGRGLSDGLIARPEESYRLWRVDVCDQETSKTRRIKPATGLYRQENKQTKHFKQLIMIVCGGCWSVALSLQIINLTESIIFCVNNDQ